VDSDVFSVQHCYIPTQDSFKMHDGLCVRVGADELYRLNRWLYEQGQALGVQVHAHPARAFHSDTDDRYPVMTTLGGLSIVVPHFCKRGLADRRTLVYRLTNDGWREL